MRTTKILGRCGIGPIPTKSPWPVAALAALLLLSGCGLYHQATCRVCKLDKDDAFVRTDAAGLVVFGVTITAAGSIAPMSGGLSWLLEAPDLFPTEFGIPLPDDMKPGERRFIVWRVPAGTWTLRQVRWKQGDHTGTSPPLGGHTLATMVMAGEAVYGGDLIIDTTHPPTTITVRRDEAAATAALTGYPAVSVQLLFRPLQNLNGASHEGRTHQQ